MSVITTPQLLQCKVQNEQLALQNFFLSVSFLNLQFAIYNVLLPIHLTQDDINAPDH
jgi:hypothetical protein